MRESSIGPSIDDAKWIVARAVNIATKTKEEAGIRPENHEAAMRDLVEILANRSGAVDALRELQNNR